jgi:cyclopropane fatty-acyl-phospholipid synthase-like methyltransferase
MIKLITNYPIAYDSLDHTEPYGTANDDTHCLPWVSEVEEHLGNKGQLVYMDLGCAGGGLVTDFLSRNHIAYGLEGSDYSKNKKRASWETIPDNLITCDISRPFFMVNESFEIVKFDIISAFEVFEHIPEKRVPFLLQNIYNHLKDDGIFAGTINVSGQKHHVTERNADWWNIQIDELFTRFAWPFPNQVRADGGNFHVALRKKI